MQKIYLDNAATTKPNFDILHSVCDQTLNDGFYNPSALYSGGREVRKKIDNVRKQVLNLFSSDYDLIFTSCGSEADNLAIFSFAKRGNVITTNAEHSAVYNTFNQLKQRGLDVRFAPVNKDGSVNEEKLLNLVDDKTTFVSIVHVNNETGAINDINRLSSLIKQKNKTTVFHSDGVQGFLKIPFKPSKNIDLYSISAHKICALKGVGGLIYKKCLHLVPQIYGGNQEKGFRSGTENVFGIEVFGKAIEKYSNVIDNFNNAVVFKELFYNALSDEVTFISNETASPYIVSFSVPGVKAEILQRILDDNGVLVGTGSACSSKVGTSRIITACGLDKKVAEGVLRASFSFETTQAEVVSACKIIKDCIIELRKKLK